MSGNPGASGWAFEMGNQVRNGLLRVRLNVTFDSKEQYLAWALHETQRSLEEALAMPSAMRPAAVLAVIVDNRQALEECGYQERPEPRESSSEREEETRAYSIPLIEAFRRAAKSYPSAEINPGIMAGAPCIGGTRIPVYMILDAIECHGSLEGAISSYARLTIQQVKDAIGFAKLVVECPGEEKICKGIPR